VTAPPLKYTQFDGRGGMVLVVVVVVVVVHPVEGGDVEGNTREIKTKNRREQNTVDQKSL